MSTERKVFSLSPGFAAQFDATESGYVYRWAYRGAAIPVSAAERDAFVAAFNRSLAIEVLIVCMCLVGVLLLTLRFIALPPIEIIGGVVLGSTASAGLAVVMFVQAWRAPVRALSGRPPIAPPLSPSEARRAARAKMGWGHVTFGLLFTLVFAERAMANSPPLGSGPWLWMTALGVATTGFAVYQKRRAQREAVNTDA